MDIVLADKAVNACFDRPSRASPSRLHTAAKRSQTTTEAGRLLPRPGLLSCPRRLRPESRGRFSVEQRTLRAAVQGMTAGKCLPDNDFVTLDVWSASPGRAPNGCRMEDFFRSGGNNNSAMPLLGDEGRSGRPRRTATGTSHDAGRGLRRLRPAVATGAEAGDEQNRTQHQQRQGLGCVHDESENPTDELNDRGGHCDVPLTTRQCNLRSVPRLPETPNNGLNSRAFPPFTETIWVEVRGE